MENSDGLLVVGTSLEVFSAFRLIRRAIELQRPIAVINIGATRLHRFANELKSDPVALSSPILFVDADCADILQQVVSRIP